ncbi:hypothetical protein [Candidatus Kuenenia sp.]|uniref:HvfA family oxazolone/thioamide-modified RiPP metallophore n=1 Tax=Candidatus Kuenenia sp. TaxID=2499824 RepID=UPI0032200F7E
MIIKKKTLLSVTLGVAFFIASALVTVVSAEANPFAPSDATTFKTDMEKKTEGKCGEGKCGGDEKKKEGKCGEGKCGGDEKKKEGKCGGDEDKKEGKCGEGKCGGDEKKKEGKCS